MDNNHESKCFTTNIILYAFMSLCNCQIETDALHATELMKFQLTTASSPVIQ